MEKSIIIYSHKIKDTELKPMLLDNGDAYDSQIEIWENSKLKWIGICNVDSSNSKDNNPNRPGIQKIELANGEYYGIAGLHRGKYKAILILNRQPPDGIKWEEMIGSEYRKLPSIYPNHLHRDRYEVNDVNIHKGGNTWDYSEGCITIPQKIYIDFIINFAFDEIIKIDKL